MVAVLRVWWCCGMVLVCDEGCGDGEYHTNHLTTVANESATGSQTGWRACLIPSTLPSLTYPSPLPPSPSFKQQGPTPHHSREQPITWKTGCSGVIGFICATQQGAIPSLQLMDCFDAPLIRRPRKVINHYSSSRISNRTLLLHSQYCQAPNYTNIIINQQWIVFPRICSEI